MSIHLIYTLTIIVSTKSDTVHMKTLLTRFWKACVHSYRDELKRAYCPKKHSYKGGFLVVIIPSYMTF
jgi:hypothetical protein